MDVIEDGKSERLIEELPIGVVEDGKPEYGIPFSREISTGSAKSFLASSFASPQIRTVVRGELGRARIVCNITTIVQGVVT